MLCWFWGGVNQKGKVSGGCSGSTPKKAQMRGTKATLSMQAWFKSWKVLSSSLCSIEIQAGFSQKEMEKTLFLPFVLFGFPKMEVITFTPFQRSQTTNPRGLGHFGRTWTWRCVCLPLDLFLTMIRNGSPIHGRTGWNYPANWMVDYRYDLPYQYTLGGGYYVIYGLFI